ncbi:ARM repeat-containing protein [Atractiella rhizophila]|nr:ARM repeat-containing protein [Atractiella rhizophila]
MFEQSISGLIKSLRAVKNDPAGEIKVIESAKRDIAVEVASTDRDLKCDAMLKAIYLDMLGHRTLHQHPFQIIELMSSTVPHHKQTGYLAAAQSFTPNTDTLLLAANLLQKDLSTSSGSRTSIAHFHTVLSNLPSLLLLEPLSPGALGLEAPTPGRRSTMISPLLSHSNPGIRRLTILLLHSLKPRTIQIPIPLLKQLLKDEDTSVQSATLSLVTELVLHEDPKEYLDVAPELFAILTTSSNNWILIKVVKAFAPLPAVEPRLLKKLGGPLTNLISNTPATSLLFECIRTCIDCGLIGASASSTLARTCIDKLGSFLQSGDQNLRYISLVALSKVLRSHSHLVARHHSTILSLIDDPDSTIRLRALDLLGGMANRQNLMDITKRLMAHFFPASNAAERSSSSAIDLLSKQQMSQSEKLVAGSSAKGSGIPLVLSPGYRSSLIGLIVKITSADSYGNITNFHWFIDVLIDLAYLSLSLSNLSSNESGGESVSEKIAAQLVDVTARVKGCRPYAVKKLERLIDDETFLENSAQSNPSSILHGTASEGAEIWEAAVWICGEYCRDSVASPDQTIRSIFRKEVSNLPTKTLTAVAHNGIKLIGKWLEALGNGDQWNEGDAARVREGLSLAVERLEEWKSQGDVELRQRVSVPFMFSLLDDDLLHAGG